MSISTISIRPPSTPSAYRRRGGRLFVFLTLALLFTSCATRLPLAEGSDYRIFRVDLGDAEVVAYPTQAGMAEDGVFQGLTVAAFAKETGADLTVNMSPFETPRGALAKARRTLGIYVNEGEMLSPPRAQYAALLFSGDGRAAIAEEQGTPLPAGTLFAFGGFFVILQEGTVIERRETRDARTAVGVSEDGRTLYVLAARGEARWNQGLTHGECAALLRDAGARDALAMDGGSSTCVVHNGRKYPSGPTWRAVGTIIGFHTIKSKIFSF